MSDLDLDAMEAVAQAATPGAWEHVRAPFRDTAGHSIKQESKVLALVGWEREEPVRAPADAAHIATFDPPTVLALIERLRTAEAERESDRLAISQARDNAVAIYRDRAEESDRRERDLLATEADLWARLAAVEAERDALDGALSAAPEVLRLAEMSDQVGAWKTRAEAAEAAVDLMEWWPTWVMWPCSTIAALTTPDTPEGVDRQAGLSIHEVGKQVAAAYQQGLADARRNDESALAAVRALADEYDAQAKVEGYGGELWTTTARAIRAALATPTTPEETQP